MADQCKRCGATLDGVADRCPTCKSFAPRNQAARTVGLRAVHQPAELRMTADELMAGIVSDLGGDSELSTLERSYVRKIGDLEITLRL